MVTTRLLVAVDFRVSSALFRNVSLAKKFAFLINYSNNSPFTLHEPFAARAWISWIDESIA